MVEVKIITPEAFAKDQKKKTIPEVGEYVTLPETTAKRLMKQGIVELSEEEKEKLQDKRNDYESKEKLKEELKKEIKTDDLIEKYFSSENPCFQRLGCGLYKGTWYYGIRIWIPEEQRFCNAIVTDKKEVYIDLPKKQGVPTELTSQIQHKFGIRYNSDFEEPDFPWTNIGVKKFLSGEIKEVDKNKIFNELIELQNKGIVWNSNEKHRAKKIACKVIASYFHPLWSNFERESQVGHTSTAKSKKDAVPYFTGFNSIKIAKQTEADLFRAIDAGCLWVFADNKDYETDEQQKATNTIVEVGFSKTGGYARTRAKNPVTGKFEVEKKAISGFMNFTSINPVDGGKLATMNRIDQNYNVAPIPQTEEEKAKFKYEYDKDKAFLDRAEELRTELRVLAYENWSNVKELYDTIQIPFIARMADKSKPILTIAKWINEQTYLDLVEYYQEKLESYQLDVQELDDEFDFIKNIRNLFNKFPAPLIIPTKELVSLWYDLNYAGEEENSKLRFKAQKEVPRRLKAATCFTRLSIKNRATAWKFKLKDLEYLRLSRGYATLKEINIELKETIDKLGNLGNSSNSSNLGNIGNIGNLDNSVVLSWDELSPYFALIDEKEAVDLGGKLPELPKMPGTYGFENKKDTQKSKIPKDLFSIVLHTYNDLSKEYDEVAVSQVVESMRKDINNSQYTDEQVLDVCKWYIGKGYPIKNDAEGVTLG